MKNLKFISLMGLIVSVAYATESIDPVWEQLLNGKDLDNWDTYLGPKYNAETGKREGEPVGLNVDPENVFSVVMLDGEPVLRISGTVYGGISTKEIYQDYHLQLKVKWGDQKHPPRENKRKDTGLIFHAHEPHGYIASAWMQGQEFQIQEGKFGDYKCFGSIMDIPSNILDHTDTYMFDESGERRTFSRKSPLGRRVKINGVSENPDGEWNTLDLYCLGDSSMFVVNGVIKMKLYNSRQLSEGKEVSLTEGKIQLQSEGVDVYFKDIQIRPITEMPEEF